MGKCWSLRQRMITRRCRMYRATKALLLGLCLLLAFAPRAEAANADGVYSMGSERGISLGQPGLQLTTTADVPTDADLAPGRLYYLTGTGLVVYNASGGWDAADSSSVTADNLYNNDVWHVVADTYARDIEYEIKELTNAFEIYSNITGTHATLLSLDAFHATSTVTDGLKLITTGSSAVMTDGVDASDAGIVNAISTGDNVILGGTTQIDFTDFDVTADGCVTIANDADTTMLTLNPGIATTLAIDATATNIVTALSVGANDILGTTGLINFTNFDVAADGDVVCVDLTPSGNVDITGTLDTAGAVTCDTTLLVTGASTLVGDVGVTGSVTIDTNLTVTGTANVNVGTWNVDKVQPSVATTTILIDGKTSGGITLGSDSTGAITLTDDVTVSDGYDLTVGEGLVVIDNDQTGETALRIDCQMSTIAEAGRALDIYATAATTGIVASITADALISGGSVLLLDSDTIPSGANFLKCSSSGSAAVFSVGTYGATVIAGNASTDVLTITAGDVQMTTGDLALTDGVMDVDIDANEGNNITRTYVAGDDSTPVLLVNSASTNSITAAMAIYQAGTGNAGGLYVSSAGDGPTVEVIASAARTGPVMDVLMTNQTAEKVLYVHGASIGAAGEGIIDIGTTGDMAQNATFLYCTTHGSSTLAGATSGFMADLNDYSNPVGTSYVAEISSVNNEALYVSSGKVLVTETVEIDTTLDVDGNIDVDGAANDLVNVSSSLTTIGSMVQLYSTGAAILQKQTMLTLNANDSGEALLDYIKIYDNAYGDLLWSVDQDGDTLIDGDLQVEGVTTLNGTIVGDGATTVQGTTRFIEVSAAGTHAVTATESGTVFYNDQACEFDLPADPTGLTFTFIVANASNLHIDPNVNDVFLYIGCAAGDRLLSATAGDTIRIFGLNTTTWYVEAVGAGDGDWTDTVWTDGN